jgi:hypothetical protein
MDQREVRLVGWRVLASAETVKRPEVVGPPDFVRAEVPFPASGLGLFQRSQKALLARSERSSKPSLLLSRRRRFRLSNPSSPKRKADQGDPHQEGTGPDDSLPAARG